MSQVLKYNPDADLIDKHALAERAEKVLSAAETRTPEEKEKVLERRRSLAALGGIAELDSLEGDYFMLNIYRNSPVLDFVEMRNLPLGSVPFYRTRFTTPVGFSLGSVNGMGSTAYYATNDAAAQVGTYTIQSDEVMVPNLNAIYDMVKLEQRAEALRRLAHDMSIAIVNANLNTMFGSTNVVSDDPATSLVNFFTNNVGSGSFAGKNVYVLDPGVIAAGVPTTNVYDLSATEQGLTKLVFQTINDWSIQIGRKIRKIYVSAAPGSSGLVAWRGLQNSASIVALTNGQGNQNPAKAVIEEQWEQFQRDDYRSIVSLDWFGLRVDIEKQNWLPANYILVLTDEPGVIMWDRLSLSTGEDRAGTLEVPVSGFMSRRSEARQIATIRPDYCLRNFMVIKIS